MREGVRGRSGLGCANDCEPLAPARPFRIPIPPPNQTRFPSLVAASPDPHTRGPDHRHFPHASIPNPISIPSKLPGPTKHPLTLCNGRLPSFTSVKFATGPLLLPPLRCPPAALPSMARDAPAVYPTRSSSFSSVTDGKELPSDGFDSEKAPVPLDSNSAHEAHKASIWKRLLVGNASASNETKRAMKSRHLTMIGAVPTTSMIHPDLCLNACLTSSHWRNDRNGHLSQRWIGKLTRTGLNSSLRRLHGADNFSGDSDRRPSKCPFFLLRSRCILLCRSHLIVGDQSLPLAD